MLHRYVLVESESSVLAENIKVAREALGEAQSQAVQVNLTLIYLHYYHGTYIKW